MDQPENTKVADGRTMMTLNGQPVLVGIATREATTAPGGTRLKAALVIPVIDGDGGVEGVAPLPFAQATMPVLVKGKIRAPRGFTPEFRLEMN